MDIHANARVPPRDAELTCLTLTSQAELEAEFDEQDLSVHAAHSSRRGDGLPWGRNLSPRVGLTEIYLRAFDLVLCLELQRAGYK